MIAKDQNIALLTVANSALLNSDWTEYANYCFDREKGLRKVAFKHLDNFLKSAVSWTLEKKIDFLNFLFPFFENVVDADYGPFPQPLSDKLIKPTLEKWCEFEQNNSNPFRWFGTYYKSEVHLLKALEIEPKDDKARQTLINCWTYNVYFSVHHLPDGYIGEPNVDIELGEKIKVQIDLLTDINLKTHLTNELEEDLELVKNYIDWTNAGSSDFATWGQENNKKVGYGLTRVYYYDK
jgi:hypothetical protein